MAFKIGSYAKTNHKVGHLLMLKQNGLKICNVSVIQWNLFMHVCASTAPDTHQWWRITRWFISFEWCCVCLCWQLAHTIEVNGCTDSLDMRNYILHRYLFGATPSRWFQARSVDSLIFIRRCGIAKKLNVKTAAVIIKLFAVKINRFCQLQQAGWGRIIFTIFLSQISLSFKLHLINIEHAKWADVLFVFYRFTDQTFKMEHSPMDLIHSPNWKSTSHQYECSQNNADIWPEACRLKVLWLLPNSRRCRLSINGQPT